MYAALEKIFFTGGPPASTEEGTYQVALVILSYLVASFASYIALFMAQQLVTSRKTWEKRVFHWGGAFAMGAGIWSMHFIGMLSYKMRMAVAYDPWLTGLSMVIAIVVAHAALAIISRGERLTAGRLATGAVLLGLGICGMHYTGMAAMEMDADLRYRPGGFALSVLVSVTAAGAALWIAFTLARNASRFRGLYQTGAALVMGAAVCGMHYTGMAAAVFLPYADCRYDPGQDFDGLALAVAVITGIILLIALSIGLYRKEEAEFRLQESESRLRAVIDGALDAVVALDSRGRVTEWNRQAEAVFGWTRGEALGRRLDDMIVHPAFAGERDGLGFFPGAGPVLNRRVETRAVRRDGAELPVEFSMTAQAAAGGPVYTAFIRDIGARRRQEEAQALLAAIVKSSDDAIVSKNLDSIILSWNSGAERLFGYSAQEAIGRHINLIIPPERTDEEMEIIAQVAAGKSIEHMETVRLTKSGSLIDISVTISPIHDAAGRIIGASKIARDITGRKKTEERLFSYMRDLERSNQELEDFAHIASHDLKEPLRGLASLSTFLLEDYGDKLDEQGHKWLNRLIDLSKRMEGLVSDLLYFSQLGRVTLAVQETDVNLLIEESRVLLETFLKERGASIVVPRPLPTVVCDRPRVMEVFRNLITNAVKYNDKPGRVVEIGHLDSAEGPEGEERGVFYVKDNGIGIAPEFYQAIFRLFKKLDTRVEDKDSGTGVGLTFVKKIVERHGGRIWLDSAPGKGTTFYFTLQPKGQG